MVESYLGAIFVDSGFDFGVIESFYAKHIKPYFEDMSLYDTFANKHPTVSILLNIPGKNRLTCYCRHSCTEN